MTEDSPKTTIEADDERLGNASIPSSQAGAEALPKESGGRAGLEPTRYGDWEKNGRCIDF